MGMEEKLFRFAKDNSTNDLSYNEFLAKKQFTENEYVDLSFLENTSIENLEFSNSAYLLILGREIDLNAQNQHLKLIQKNKNKYDYLQRQIVDVLVNSNEARNKGRKFYNNIFDNEEVNSKYKKISKNKADVKDWIYHNVFLKSPSFVKVASRKFYYKFIRKV